MDRDSLLARDTNRFRLSVFCLVLLACYFPVAFYFSDPEFVPVAASIIVGPLKRVAFMHLFASLSCGLTIYVAVYVRRWLGELSHADILDLMASVRDARRRKAENLLEGSPFESIGNAKVRKRIGNWLMYYALLTNVKIVKALSCLMLTAFFYELSVFLWPGLFSWLALAAFLLFLMLALGFIAFACMEVLR